MAEFLGFEPKIIVQKVCYDLVNNHLYDSARDYFDSDIKFTFNQNHLNGRDNLILLLKKHADIFPSTHVEITSIISEGDTACARWKMVFTGNRNKQVFSTSGITMFQFRNDKIIKAHQFWNTDNLKNIYVQQT